GHRKGYAEQCRSNGAEKFHREPPFVATPQALSGGLRRVYCYALYSWVWLTAARPTHFGRFCSLLRSRATRHPKKFNPRLRSLGPGKPKRRVADPNARRGWRSFARELSPSTSSSAASQMDPSLMKRVAIQRRRRRYL